MPSPLPSHTSLVESRKISKPWSSGSRKAPPMASFLLAAFCEKERIAVIQGARKMHLDEVPEHITQKTLPPRPTHQGLKVLEVPVPGDVALGDHVRHVLVDKGVVPALRVGGLRAEEVRVSGVAGDRAGGVLRCRNMRTMARSVLARGRWMIWGLIPVARRNMLSGQYAHLGWVDAFWEGRDEGATTFAGMFLGRRPDLISQEGGFQPT